MLGLNSIKVIIVHNMNLLLLNKKNKEMKKYLDMIKNFSMRLPYDNENKKYAFLL